MPPAIQVENLSRSYLVGYNNVWAASPSTPMCHSEDAIAGEESQAKGTGRSVMMQRRWVEILRFTQDDMEAGGAQDDKKGCHSEVAIAAEESMATATTTALRDVFARIAKNLARKTHAMPPAIKVENLSKFYLVGHNRRVLTQ